MKRLHTFPFLIIASLTALSIHAAEQAPSARIDSDGTVYISKLEVPLSSYMSAEARQSFIDSTREPMPAIWEDPNAPIEKLRAMSEGGVKGAVERSRAKYAVDIQEQRIGSVRTRVVTPKAGVPARNARRVLVELHGGGFFTGAEGQALLEAIPIAAVGGFKVVAVDYRQGPENKFPAASEDTAAVYKELLKDHRPTDIGLYGCSAGGSLAAMAVSWFQKHDLPRPGALGILGAGAFGGFEDPPSVAGSWGGDSRFTTPLLGGEPAWPVDPKQIRVPKVTTIYLEGANLQDPLVSPGLWPNVLAKFPPTLLLTTTRSFDMSAAVQTHRELVKAGVDADLHMWDGLGHCFFTDVNLPESREAYAVITKFFDQRLGR